MFEHSIIGLDLAKSVFQVHIAAPDGRCVLRKRLRRGRVLGFFAGQPASLVAMEASASAHHWAREIGKLGHEVRLMAPGYVKPYVKRQKNDMADAEAIAEAASRASMRFVAVKTVERQAAGMAFRTRDLFVRQRTQTVNALRGHLAEYGAVAPKGIAHVARLRAVLASSDNGLPAAVVELAGLLLEQIDALDARIAGLEREVRGRARADELGRRLMDVPGIGPVAAAAMLAFAPPAESFAKGRDFAAWLGLVPRQSSSGARERLGRITRAGQRDLRRLLISGAMAVVRWARRKGARPGSWLARMLAAKPPMLVAVALANRTARICWALMARGGVYREDLGQGLRQGLGQGLEGSGGGGLRAAAG
jgi:transposase